MSTTVLPQAIILTKAHRAAVSIVSKGCIVARVLSLRCFLFLLPNFTNFQCTVCSDEPEVFLSKYSQTAKLYATQFRRVGNKS